MSHVLPKLVFVILFVVLASIALIAWQSDSSPSAKLYDKITPGMTRTEVEKVFGRKNGALGNNDDDTLVMMVMKEDDRNREANGKPSSWSNRKWQITVYFDGWGDDAKVVGKQRLEAKTN